MADTRLANYQIVVLDPLSNTVIDIVQGTRLKDLNYSRVVNDIGVFALTVDADDNLANLVNRLDLVFQIQRQNDPSSPTLTIEDNYLLRYADIFEDENYQEWVILGGYHANQLLQRRLIRFEDDPLGADGFSSKFGAGDVVMREFVDEQIINPFNLAGRIFPQFQLAPLSGATFDNTFQRRSYDNLLSVLQEIEVATDCDFEIKYEGGFFTFYAHQIGTDRTQTTNYPNTPFTLFAPERGNLKTPRLLQDRKAEKTIVYVGSQGQDDSRLYLRVDANTRADSPYNWIEDTTDSRQTDDTDGLIASGQDFLRRNQPKIEFTFTPDLLASQAQYNLDWQLGDLVTVRYRDVQLDVRIKSVTIKLSASNESIEIVTEQESTT